MKKILFVCTGNICRSPTAEAIARYKAKNLQLENKFFFDSAGTEGFHSGESADARAIEVGAKRGVLFDDIISRKVCRDDFKMFDFLMAMDRSHYNRLIAISPSEHHHKIKLFLEFCDVKNPWNNEVVDPYYRGYDSFEEVFDVLEMAVENMFDKVLM